MEQICAADNQHGNSMAMMKLILNLRHRDDKWFVHLVAATRECGYLLDDINPRLKEAGRDIFKCDIISLHRYGFWIFSMHFLVVSGGYYARFKPSTSTD